MRPPPANYSFGDSEIAAKRLEIVAQTFAPTSSALLRSLEATPTRVLDLGCGPGHTTALLEALYPSAEIVAVEISESFAAQARERVAAARVIVDDVTAPLPDGFDLVYARFLLSHLPDIDAAVKGWCRAVSPGGSLVLEEPESIVAVDELFARYEAIVAGVVAASGADMYAGIALAGMETPTGFLRAVDHAVDPGVTSGAAASMFWRNARAWDSRADALATPAEIEDLISRLQSRVDDPRRDEIRWQLRQLVLTRNAT